MTLPPGTQLGRGGMGMVYEGDDPPTRATGGRMTTTRAEQCRMSVRQLRFLAHYGVRFLAHYGVRFLAHYGVRRDDAGHQLWRALKQKSAGRGDPGRRFVLMASLGLSPQLSSGTN